MESDLKIGDCIRAPIVDVAFGGDGVARVSGRAVFVPFTVDGDEVKLRIVEVRKRYARARLVQISTPSIHRAPPACADYMRCGGCRTQHIRYGHQLDLKRRQVEESFKRIAGIPEAPLMPVIPSPRTLGWRGKAAFHLERRCDGPVRVGLMAAASHEIVEVERCAIVAESVHRKYREFREVLRLSESPIPGDRLVIWSDEAGEPPTPLYTGSGRPPDVTRVVQEKRLTVPGRGFFQANVALVGELVEQAARMANLSGGETVIDAYAGAGLFSLFLAERVGALWAVEGDRDAARCAGVNLDRAGFPEARAVCGDVAKVLTDFGRSGMKADVILLDPPRDGCGEGVVEAVAALGPERIVYISCNPATQARDVCRLAGRGYVLRRLQPLDMFPQTGHIEVIALLMRANAS